MNCPSRITLKDDLGNLLGISCGAFPGGWDNRQIMLQRSDQALDLAGWSWVNDWPPALERRQRTSSSQRSAICPAIYGCWPKVAPCRQRNLSQKRYPARAQPEGNTGTTKRQPSFDLPADSSESCTVQVIPAPSSGLMLPGWHGEPGRRVSACEVCRTTWTSRILEIAELRH